MREDPTRTCARPASAATEELRPAVESEIKVALLAPEITKAESIEVSDGDVDEQLKRIAESSERKFGELKREYREQGLIEALRAESGEQKAVEFALDAAKFLDA